MPKDIDEILANIDEVDDFARKLGSDEPKDEKSGPDAEITLSEDTLQENKPGISDHESSMADETLRPEYSDQGAPREEISRFLPVIFTLRGTKNWNTREPYILRTDEGKYRAEKGNLAAIFFFLTERLEGEALQRKIRDEILRHDRGTSGNILSAYAQFIAQIVSQEMKNASGYFKIAPKNEKLFIYHLGPMTHYRILIDFLQNQKIGFGYRQLADRKVSRFLPEEYLKGLVLSWLEENVNSLDLPFDGIHQYEGFRDAVSRMYQAVLKKFNMRLVELNSKLTDGRHLTGEELVRLKGRQWFGASNIFIYKRFIPKTIFSSV